MNLKILSLLIIEVCILLPDVCYAFFSKDVHLLNMQNGLADNTVSAVYKDKEGFVWFGTRNGLSRYDGRRITNFEISSSYPSISNLKEAFDGVLAFVDNGVFSAFDLKKERFLSVVSSSGQGIPSRGMLQKNDSLVWVISGSELHLMKRCASKALPAHWKAAAPAPAAESARIVPDNRRLFHAVRAALRWPPDKQDGCF